MAAAAVRWTTAAGASAAPPSASARATWRAQLTAAAAVTVRTDAFLTSLLLAAPHATVVHPRAGPVRVPVVAVNEADAGGGGGGHDTTGAHDRRAATRYRPAALR